jgi:hypothetical protein
MGVLWKVSCPSKDKNNFELHSRLSLKAGIKFRYLSTKPL